MRSFVLALPTQDRSDVFEPFAAALGARAGCEIRILPLSSYAGTIDAMERGCADFAWAPPIVALDLVACQTASPIAAVTRAGRASYPSLLVVRRGSTVRTLDDLAGRRVAWVSKLSAAGFIVPRLHLDAHGAPANEVFAEQLFAGSHARSLDLLASGAVEVAATYGRPGSIAPPRSDSLATLAIAGNVPSEVIVARRHVGIADRRRLAAALIDLDRAATAPLRRALGVDGFVPADEEHLDPLDDLRMRARVGAPRSFPPLAGFPPVSVSARSTDG